MKNQTRKEVISTSRKLEKDWSRKQAAKRIKIMADKLREKDRLEILKKASPTNPVLGKLPIYVKHRLAKPKVLLAFPTYEGKQRFETSMCVLDLTRIMDKVEFVFTALPQDAAIGRLRNHAAWFLLERTDCDYMLQIDHDITFTPDDIVRILSHGEDIVGGLYPAKQIERPRWVVTGLKGEEPDERGLEKCMEMGTGFLLTHRSVFEKMKAAYPEEAYHCDADPTRPMKHDFFKFGVVNKRYLSEDYYFCYRARCLGFDIYADHGIKLGHIGPHEFKGPPTDKRETVTDESGNNPVTITTRQTVLP